MKESGIVVKRILVQKIANHGAWLQWALVVVALLTLATNAQERRKTNSPSEHDNQILGVRIGMNVSDALKAVFEHTATMPAPQKPDALRKEDKNSADIRVIYKNLKEGEIQIVFAGGNTGVVREVMLTYAKHPTVSDLHLPLTGSISASGDVLNSGLNSGERFDDRYTIGFTSDRKTERYWWRDEQLKDGYSLRIAFVSGDLKSGGAMAESIITRKLVTVKPGDEQRFWKAVKPK